MTDERMALIELIEKDVDSDLVSLCGWHSDAVCGRSDQGNGASGVSKSQVSRLVEEIDGRVNANLGRPISRANGPPSGSTQLRDGA